MVHPAPKLVAFLALLPAIVQSTPALAERCSKPSRPLTCGQAPLTYECPPCPPSGVGLAMPDKLEGYREALESYREGVEEMRANRPGGSLVDYDKALKKYQDGISAYKDAVASTSRDPE